LAGLLLESGSDGSMSGRRSLNRRRTRSRRLRTGCAASSSTIRTSRPSYLGRKTLLIRGSVSRTPRRFRGASRPSPSLRAQRALSRFCSSFGLHCLRRSRPGARQQVDDCFSVALEGHVPQGSASCVLLLSCIFVFSCPVLIPLFHRESGFL
jgi:hypothetical protein